MAEKWTRFDYDREETYPPIGSLCLVIAERNDGVWDEKWTSMYMAEFIDEGTGDIYDTKFWVFRTRWGEAFPYAESAMVKYYIIVPPIPNDCKRGEE